LDEFAAPHLTLRHAFVGNSLIHTARPTMDGNINLDGVVNGLDIGLIASHWLQTGSSGSGMAVPEPPTLILDATAGLALLAPTPAGMMHPVVDPQESRLAVRLQ
jgi:hypothetical protein